MNNWSDRLSVIFKGPGWQPGKPRLGDNNFPKVKNLKKKTFFPDSSFNLFFKRWNFQ